MAGASKPKGQGPMSPAGARGGRTGSAGKGKRMTVAEKYASLKRQTEQAGMTIAEVDGRLVVSRKKPGKLK